MKKSILCILLLASTYTYSDSNNVEGTAHNIPESLQMVFTIDPEVYASEIARSSGYEKLESISASNITTFSSVSICQDCEKYRANDSAYNHLIWLGQELGANGHSLTVNNLNQTIQIEYKKL